MKNKLIPIMLGLTLLIPAKRAVSVTTTLYDGTSGVAPSQSGAAPNGPFFGYGELSSYPKLCYTSCTSPTPSTIQTIGSNGVTLNTNFNNDNSGYSGYSSHMYSSSNGLTPVNSNFPTLDPSTGFSISFNVAVTNENSTLNNRAGFSVIVIGNDQKGVELGFKSSTSTGSNGTSNSIIEQSDSFSTPVQSQNVGSINTLTSYTLSILNGNYTLTSGSSSSLKTLITGSTHSYQFSPTTSNPPLPPNFNPYTTPNYLFFGDNTDEGSSNFTLGTITANTAAVPYEFSPSLGILILAAGGGVTQVLKKKRFG